MSPLSERDLVVLRMLVATCDPDVLNQNLESDSEPEADLDELDALLARLES